MRRYITINDDFTVREVVDAEIATGFLIAPRPDIKRGDVLTEYEKMVCGLIPWDQSLVPVPPASESPAAES